MNGLVSSRAKCLAACLGVAALALGACRGDKLTLHLLGGADVIARIAPLTRTGGDVPIEYWLLSQKSLAASVIAEYSVDGGASFKVAGTRTGLATTRVATASTRHTFIWNPASAGLTLGTRIVFTLTPIVQDRVGIPASVEFTLGDARDPNNTPATASDIAVQYAAAAKIDGLHVSPGDPLDYFTFRNTAAGALAGTLVEVSIAFTHRATGDLNLFIVDAVDRVLAGSESTTDNEAITFLASRDERLYIRVQGRTGQTESAYSLRAKPVLTGLGDREDNGTAPKATDLTKALGQTIGGLEISYDSLNGDDDDYYKLTATGGDLVRVSVAFSHSAGDIDMALLQGANPTSLTEVSFAMSEDDGEEAVVAKGTYYLHIRGKPGTSVKNAYSLLVEEVTLPAGADLVDEGFDGAGVAGFGDLTKATWTATGEWEIGTPTGTVGPPGAVSNPRVAATVVNGLTVAPHGTLTLAVPVPAGAAPLAMTCHMFWDLDVGLDSFWVEAREDGGLWDNLLAVTADPPSSGGGYKVFGFVKAVSQGTSQVSFRFRYQVASRKPGLYLDDIKVSRLK
ncbi:hypothetical protein ACFL59_06960 [Planctomycetota bacterium]